MATRRFQFGEGDAAFVPVTRGGDDERLELAAVDRMVNRAGDERIEIIVELPDGTFRNMGAVDWDDIDDLWDYVDAWLDDNDYGGDGAAGVSVVWR